MENESLEDIMSGLSDKPVENVNVNEEAEKVIAENEEVIKESNKTLQDYEVEYVTIARQSDAIDRKIDNIKQSNKALFDEIQKLEFEKAKINEPVDSIRNSVTELLRVLPDGSRKYSGLEVSFAYRKGSVKVKFNSDKFQLEQPTLYSKYCEQTIGKDTTVIKCTLLGTEEDK